LWTSKACLRAVSSPGRALFLAGKRCAGEATLDAVLAAVESTERSGER